LNHMGFQVSEFLENPENRCPVLLILDVSASMQGTPIEALNEGLAEFKFDVEQDALAALRVEVCLVTFGAVVKQLQPFVTIDDFTPPVLDAAGKTPMGAAIEKGLEALEERKQTYHAQGIGYYRPWVFLITDGAPTDLDVWEQAIRKIHRLEMDNRLTFFAVGVEGADQDILEKLAPPGRTPFFLKDLKFKELFRWVSASVKRVSMGRVGSGDMMALPPVSDWAA
jgi:uncharacterized protein YegL